MKKFGLFNSTYAILFFVAEGDEHYSPARIAGTVGKKESVAEGDEQFYTDCCSPSASGRIGQTNPAILAGL